ncbi:L-histidine N(alpha)-methyltransferase [Synechococcus sp. RSCCF101]|nr:L-histidine N(alpha)-methyltransferase [Synechococcus sp. RSCCF101]
MIDLHPRQADLASAVEAGLCRTPRQLPAWLLYDAEGSRLFDAICHQPEYSLTRTETALLEQRGPAIGAHLGQGVLVEFGAGSARKVRPLLDAMHPRAYVPLDISASHLQESCALLQAQHPSVPIVAVCCDYSALQELPPHPLLSGAPRVGFFPGSSIGNFSHGEATRLLRRFRALLGEGGRLLIGIDRPRAVERMEAAYDDAAGVSAAFAFNLLSRLNRDLGADFDPDRFRYRALWQERDQRIEMALVSRQRQEVQLLGRSWLFEAGEPLVTEHSHKFTPQRFSALAAGAGWDTGPVWSDSSDHVSLLLLEPARLGVSQRRSP